MTAQPQRKVERVFHTERLRRICLRVPGHLTLSYCSSSISCCRSCTLIKNYVFGDESDAGAALSLACRRQIDFVEEPSIPKAPQLPMQEELQKELTEAAIEVLPSILPVHSPFVLSSNPAVVQSVAGSVESITPANVQSQPEGFVNDVLPPSPPHIV